jgi:hypothetical protein
MRIDKGCLVIFYLIFFSIIVFRVLGVAPHPGAPDFFSKDLYRHFSFSFFTCFTSHNYNDAEVALNSHELVTINFAGVLVRVEPFQHPLTLPTNIRPG